MIFNKDETVHMIKVDRLENMNMALAKYRIGKFARKMEVSIINIREVVEDGDIIYYKVFFINRLTKEAQEEYRKEKEDSILMSDILNKQNENIENLKKLLSPADLELYNKEILDGMKRDLIKAKEEAAIITKTSNTLKSLSSIKR